jgi:hypothetical protein
MQVVGMFNDVYAYTNADMVLMDGDVWLIQVYTDWSDMCQHFSPTWEELARKLEGTVKVL